MLITTAYILGLLTGFVVSYVVARYLMWLALQQARQQILTMIQEVEQDAPTVRVTVEQHNGTFLLYDADNNFLAQGETLQDLRARIDHKFSDQTHVIITSTDSDVLARLQGTKQDHV